MRRCSPASSCRTFSTGIAAMVVQLGLAMMPFGGFFACSGFTSLTTSGTSGSLRNAEELSTTVAPAAAKRGACSRDSVAPAENRAMSMPFRSSSDVADASSTTISSPRNGSFLPADRAEAKNRTLSAGKLRSSRRVRMTMPTCPVAPTTAMVVMITVPFLRARRLLRRRRARMHRGSPSRPCPAPRP